MAKLENKKPKITGFSIGTELGMGGSCWSLRRAQKTGTAVVAAAAAAAAAVVATVVAAVAAAVVTSQKFH